MGTRLIVLETAGKVDLPAVPGQRHTRLAEIEQNGYRADDIVPFGMAAADRGVVETQLIETPARVAPAALQCQKRGVIVQAEPQGAATVTHAIEIGAVGVGKTIDVAAKAEGMQRGDAVAEFRREADGIFRRRQKGTETEEMTGAGMVEPGIILVHQLQIGLERHAAQSVAVFEIPGRLVLGLVDVVGIVGEVEIVAKRGTGMVLPAEFFGARNTNFKAVEGMNGDAGSVEIRVGLDARPVQISQKKLRLPWAQPAQHRPA